MLTKDKVLKGRYRIINQLGRHEKGAVYEAYDSIRKANVALKEILIDSEKVPAISERENLKRAFAERAKILAEIKHESLPQIRGYFSEFDRQYLVIELINGDDARALLSKNEKPITFADAANWADQLLDALDYLHTLPAPIIHGDVTPQNIKLNSRGRIKLLGFDITESAEAKTKTLVSGEITAAESLSYLAPEQLLRMTDAKTRRDFAAADREQSDEILRQPIDARSDIYALGATLYHLACGQMPVNALERMLIFSTEKRDPLKTAQTANPAIPAELSEILAKALRIKSADRFASASEMRRSLREAAARAQENQAETAKTLESKRAQETLLAEEKRLTDERRSVEQERLRLEAEHEQQAKLIEQQLKTAEAERLKAEQRAAEAEKQLLEKQDRNAAEEKVSTINDLPTEAVMPKTFAADASKIAENKASNLNQSAELFAEIAQSKKPSRLMPVAAALILLIGGAAAGVWAWRSPKNVVAESNQPAATQTSVPAVQTAPLTETVPATVAENIPAVNSVASPAINTAPPFAEKTGGQTAPRNKIAAVAPPRAAKPATPKAPANQNKAVTVDDLIGN